MTETYKVVVEEAPPQYIYVEEPEGGETVIETEPVVETVEIEVEGPPGPPGKSAYELALLDGFVGTRQEWLDSLAVAGPPGPAGGDLSYRHVQNIPASQWGSEEDPINHGLGKFPNHGVINSAGDAINVGIVHLDENNCYLTLSGLESGKAYFN